MTKRGNNYKFERIGFELIFLVEIDEIPRENFPLFLVICIDHWVLVRHQETVLDRFFFRPTLAQSQSGPILKFF